ncbi:MAG TPA: tetratricopeptide repeat protein [Candidatus Acidoferrum sp.]|nr:tetratricopeptide repeat protein [Candidatus Acidoferrum sp.]
MDSSLKSQEAWEAEPESLHVNGSHGTTGPEQSVGRRHVALLAVLLAVATAGVYAPAMRNGFVNLDDPDYVTRNPYVLHGLTWTDIKWALGSNYPSSNWHPLTWISHMTDVQLYGLHPAGHHFSNVALHILAVVLLFLLFERATGLPLRSAAVAALFAVQPLNVEAVAWISERKSVLCVLFFLLGIVAYGWYLKKPSVWRYFLLAVCFALGITAKVMVIPFPFALLLLDYWPLARLPGTDAQGKPRAFFPALGALILEKIPLFVMAAAGAAVTVYVHSRERALTAAMPFSWRFKNAIFSYMAYLGKAVWPVRLAPFYPHPENTLTWTAVGLAALVLAAISVKVWRMRARKYLVMGWLWYLGTMFPMIGFVQTGRQGMADRFMHIPMMGLLVAMIWLIGEVSAEKHWQKEILIAAFLLAVAPFTAVTIRQIGFWHDSYTLFAHTLEATQNNGMAENNFGVALVERGESELAAQHFAAAIRFSPDLASPRYNFAVYLQRHNRLAEAEREYKAALALSTDQTEIVQSHNNLGILYLSEHNYAPALVELNSALALDPGQQNSYIGRGTIELNTMNLDAAVADFTRAAQIAPSPIALYWLGQTLERKGDMQRAVQAYEAALRLAPGMAEARARLAALGARVQ